MSDSLTDTCPPILTSYLSENILNNLNIKSSLKVYVCFIK